MYFVFYLVNLIVLIKGKKECRRENDKPFISYDPSNVSRIPDWHDNSNVHINLKALHEVYCQNNCIRFVGVNYDEINENNTKRMIFVFLSTLVILPFMFFAFVAYAMSFTLQMAWPFLYGICGFLLIFLVRYKTIGSGNAGKYLDSAVLENNVLKVKCLCEKMETQDENDGLVTYSLDEIDIKYEIRGRRGSKRLFYSLLIEYKYNIKVNRYHIMMNEFELDYLKTFVTYSNILSRGIDVTELSNTAIEEMIINSRKLVMD